MGGWSIVSESDASPSSAKGASDSGWSVVDEKSPEELDFENKLGTAAVKTVPKPAFLSYQPTEIDPLNVRGQGKGLQPVRTPYNLPPVSHLDALKAALSATPPQSETPLLPGAASEVSAAQHLATPGKRWQGATEAVQGVGEAATPFMGPAAIESAAALPAALKLAGGFGVGLGAQKGAGAIAHAAGASPEQQQFWEELGFWAPSIAGMLSSQAGVKGGIEATPEGTRAAVTGFKGKAGAGVSVTPEGVTVRGKVGPFEGSKTFNRGPQPAAPAPSIEPPAIDNPVSTAASSMAKANTNASEAKLRAAGVPPPPPPAPPSVTDEPGAPPELKNGHIPQKLVDNFAGVVAALPESLRAQAIQEAHGKLAQVILEGSQQGPMVGPEGKLIPPVKDLEGASKVAIGIINDAISNHEKVAAAVSSKPAPVSGEGAGAGITKARAGFKSGKFQVVAEEEKAVESPHEDHVQAANEGGVAGRGEPAPAEPDHANLGGRPAGERGPAQQDAGAEVPVRGTAEGQPVPSTHGFEVISEEPRTPEFSKGQEVTAPNGHIGKIYWSGINPQGKEIVRMKTAAGERFSVDAATLKSSQEAATAPKPTADTSEPTKPESIATVAENKPEQGSTGRFSPEERATMDSALRATTPSIKLRQRVAATPDEKVVGMSTDGNKNVYVPLLRDGERIGSGWIGERSDLGDGVAEVHRVDIKPEHQGKGKAKELYAELFKEAKKEGFTRLLSDSVQVPAASRAWEGMVRRGLAKGVTDAYGEKRFEYLGKPEQGEFSHEAKGEEVPSLPAPNAPEKPAETPAKDSSGGVPVEAGKSETPTKYKFGNTQAPIHPDSEAAKSLESARARISESDLAGKGRDIGDGGNHVTVRYGIQDDETGGIKKFLSQQAPFEATLGKTDSFPPSEHSDGAAPIIAPVNAPDLHRMNAELEKHGNFSEPSFKEFKPHATIGYVAPEKASRYTGMSVTEGKKFTVDRVAITDRNGGAEIVKLEGKRSDPGEVMSKQAMYRLSAGFTGEGLKKEFGLPSEISLHDLRDRDLIRQNNEGLWEVNGRDSLRVLESKSFGSQTPVEGKPTIDGVFGKLRRQFPDASESRLRALSEKAKEVRAGHEAIQNFGKAVKSKPESRKEAPAKQPWEMNRKEWQREIDDTDINFTGTGGDAKYGMGRSTKEGSFNTGVERRKFLRGGVADKRIEGLQIAADHKDVVTAALKAGKPVPAEVLKEYPDLKPEKVEPVVATKSPVKKSVTAKDKEYQARLASMYTPGNIIHNNYWNSYSKVLAFTPQEGGEPWSVREITTDKEGNPLPGEKARTHHTYPDKRDFIVKAAEAAPVVAEEVKPAKEPEAVLAGESPRIVPGARSADTGKETGTTTIQDLTDSIKRQIPEKTPLKERLKQGADLGGKVGDAKDAVTNTLNRLKGSMAALWDAYNRLPKWEDYEDATGKWSGADQENALDLRRFTEAIKKAVPSKLKREGISNWIEAAGDDTVLRQRADASEAKWKPGYEAALKLDDEEKTVARNIMNRNDATLEEAQAAGLLQQGVENYVRHVYADSPKAQAKIQAELNFATLQTKPGFTKQRKIPTYFDAEQLGFKPKDKDVGYLTAIHERSFREALAARDYIKALMNGTESDGRPLIITSWAGARELSAAEGKAAGAYLIQPNIKRGEEAGDYMHIDHPALRGWKWAGKTEDGSDIFVQGDALVHPKIYQKLKNNLSKSAIRNYSVDIAGHNIRPGEFALNASAEVKHAILSFSGFHQTTLGLHALEHRTLPAGMPELDLNQADQKGLVDHGLMVASYDAAEAFGEGVASGGLITKIPGIGPQYHQYTEYLFNSFLPRIKMATGLNVLERNRARYGKELNDDQIKAITAEQVNASFGGLNMRMIGRSRTLQDVLRLSAMAPDFFEARARYVGQGAKPYGREQLVALVGGALALYTIARILNMITDRDPHWNKPFAVVYRGKEYTMRTVQEDLYRAITNTGPYLMARVSPVVSAAIHLGEERNRFGQKQDFMGWLKDLARTNVPIPLQPWTRPSHDTNAQKAVETISKMVGVNVKNAEDKHSKKMILESLRKGDDQPLHEAVKEHKLTLNEAHELRRRARLTPLQDKARHEKYKDLLRQYNSASDSEKKELAPILREKRLHYMISGHSVESEPVVQ